MWVFGTASCLLIIVMLCVLHCIYKLFSQGRVRDQQVASFVGSIPVLTKNKRGEWIRCCGHNIPIHADYRDPVEEKGRPGHSLKRRAPRPLPWQALTVFLGPLHQRRPPLLCKGLFWVVIFYRQRRGCRWIHQRRIFAVEREKWSKPVMLYTWKV